MEAGRGEKKEEDEMEINIFLASLFLANFNRRLTFARLTPVVARGRCIKVRSTTRTQDNR